MKSNFFHLFEYGKNQSLLVWIVAVGKTLSDSVEGYMGWFAFGVAVLASLDGFF